MKALSIMPGEHDWMKQAPRGPRPNSGGGGGGSGLGNALQAGLEGFAQVAAPEAYERSRTNLMSDKMGNALQAGNYDEAAGYAFKMPGGRGMQAGMQLQQYGQGLQEQDQARIQEMQAAAQEQEREQAARQLSVAYEANMALLNTPPEQRAQVAQQLGQELGMEPDDGPYDDASIRAEMAQMKVGFAQLGLDVPELPQEEAPADVEYFAPEPVQLQDGRTVLVAYPKGGGEPVIYDNMSPPEETITPYQRETLALRRREFEDVGSGYRTLTPDEVKYLGLPAGTLAQLGPDGQLRIVREGEDPNAPGDSMLGAESMARAASGLPGAIEAASRLKDLFLPEPGTKDKKGKERSGYRTGHDWGAQALDAIPLPGSDTLASKVGGDDYREFNQAFSQFEAAIMPIMSGAAVSESEAQRLIGAIKPENNDSEQQLRQKFAQMDRITQGLEAAMNGDRAFLDAMLEESRGARSALSASGATGVPPEARALGITPAQWELMTPEEKAVFE